MTGYVPALPLEKKDAKNKNSETASEKEKDTQHEYNMPVEIHLGDKRSLSGKIHFKSEKKLTVNHEREGILYKKTFLVDDIEEIEIKKWKGLQLKKTKEGDVYQFNSAVYKITLKDKTSLQVNDEILSFLGKIDLINKNGSVTLFTYWLDLQKSSGEWYTGMTGPASGFRITPHKDVIQKIVFEKNKTK